MIGCLRDCLHLRCDALAPHTETYQAGGQPAQNRKIDEEPEEPRRLDFAGAAEDAGDYSFLNHDLKGLYDFGWPFAPLLHLRQKLIIQRPVARQWSGEEIRRRDCVLNREIDADAADRRHGMRGISDA
jgi:hypothetical protein